MVILKREYSEEKWKRLRLTKKVGCGFFLLLKFYQTAILDLTISLYD